MKQRIAVFPGSFDPITLGHTDLIERAAPLFDLFIIAIGVNSQKSSFFPIEKRMEWLQTLYGNRPGFQVYAFEGMTVHFCKEHDANWIVRGVRNSSDFDYERTIALLNQSMEPGLETLLLPSAPHLSHISSTIVREMVRYKGVYAHLVPDCVTAGA